MELFCGFSDFLRFSPNLFDFSTHFISPAFHQPLSSHICTERCLPCLRTQPESAAASVARRRLRASHGISESAYFSRFSGFVLIYPVSVFPTWFFVFFSPTHSNLFFYPNRLNTSSIVSGINGRKTTRGLELPLGEKKAVRVGKRTSGASHVQQQSHAHLAWVTLLRLAESVCFMLSLFEKNI